MPIGPDEVKGHLRNNWGIDPGFPHLPVFGGNSYEFVNEGWFNSDWFTPFWHATKPRVKWYERIFRYNVWDCNLYTGWGAMVAQALNREAGGKHAVLVGEFWYYRKSNPADVHAMAIGMFAPDRIGFKELQTGQAGVWTPEEKCTWYHFK
jgi:hypothetical protein